MHCSLSGISASTLAASRQLAVLKLREAVAATQNERARDQGEDAKQSCSLGRKHSIQCFILPEEETAPFLLLESRIHSACRPGFISNSVK